jgi:hypothetical protein
VTPGFTSILVFLALIIGRGHANVAQPALMHMVSGRVLVACGLLDPVEPSAKISMCMCKHIVSRLSQNCVVHVLGIAVFFLLLC